MCPIKRIDIPTRKKVINDDNLFKLAISDYLRSQYYSDDLKTSKILTISNEILNEAKQFYSKLSPKQKIVFELGVLVPVSVLGFSQGFLVPDLDITMIGIGWHRYFLTHSAVGAYVTKYFFSKYNEFISMKLSQTSKRVMGSFLAAGSIGLGIHLLADGSFGLLDGEKSIVYGIPGFGKIDTLVTNTMVDDNIFLLANSLWAFKIAKDIIVLTFGNDLEVAKNYVNTHFPRNKLEKIYKK